MAVPRWGAMAQRAPPVAINPRGGNDPREFVVIQHTIPSDFLGRRGHAVGG